MIRLRERDKILSEMGRRYFSLVRGDVFKFDFQNIGRIINMYRFLVLGSGVLSVTEK